ncbi:MAG: hypothetical protein WCD83_01220, partial [Pseudolabrys sp.]
PLLFQNRPNALQGIAPNARRSFRQGQHNQRFCNPQCKDDFHNEANQAAAFMLGLSPSVANREHLGKASNGLAKGNTLSSRQHRGVSG